MTDTTNEAQEAPAQETEQAEAIDWKAKAREWERRAKDNKSAADELASLRDSQKTAEQRFEERLSEMEKRAHEAEAKALRSDIAATFGISAEDRDLFLIGTDAETLTAQAKRLSERQAEVKKQGNVARNEGGTKILGSENTEAREFVGSLFNRAE